MYEEGQEALCVDIPVLIKAHTDGDKRLVEVEASNEVEDTEGDVIQQGALLDDAANFVKSGHLDIDHLSEIGDRLGLVNPSSYIVGVPTEVRDMGGGRTAVRGELQKGRQQAEELWSGLTADPPVRWRASIYGFPKSGMVDDFRVTKGGPGSPKRFLIKGLHWRSLAFTRNPVNDAITGAAQVVTAKSMVAIMKSRGIGKNFGTPMDAPQAMPEGGYILTPRNREELMGHFHYSMEAGRSPYANQRTGYSIQNFRDHFLFMCCCTYEEADILALALMQMLKRTKRPD